MQTKPIDSMYIMRVSGCGIIGIAEHASTLIDLLIDRGDLNSNTRVIFDQTLCDRLGVNFEVTFGSLKSYSYSIADLIGNNWVDFVKSLTIDDFNEMFKYDFWIDCAAVYR